MIHRPGLLDGRQDIGRILEVMLYYDRVHLMMSAQLFTSLWDELGPDDFYVLLDHPTITTTLTPEVLGIQNNIGSLVTTHRPVSIKVAGREGSLVADKDDVGTLLHMLGGPPKRPSGTWGQVNRLVKLAKRSRYAKILGGSAQSRERLFSLIRDPDTLKLFVRGWAAASGQILNEAAMQQAKISTIELGEEFTILSTIPMENIVSGWNPRETWGVILANVQDYAVDLYLSDAHGADIVTTPAVAEIASARVDLSLQRAHRNRGQLSSFEELVFEEAHGFADAFNGGLITFSEAIKVIDKSRRFRTWTRGLAPDADLINEYHRAVTRETVLKSLPASIARFAIFNGAGMTADAMVPGTGLVASAIDTFIVERLLSGWRPNIFVRNMRKTLAKARTRASQQA